jgi:hypothetical protein
MKPLGTHSIYLFLELTAFLMAVISYLRHRDPVSKWFVVLLLLTNLVEWGNLFRLYSIRHSNNWIFNLFNPLEFAFYVCLFYSLYKNKEDKRKVARLYLGLLILTVLNILFLQGIRYFDSYSFMLGSLLILYCVYLFFKQLMQHVDDQNILKNRFFWVSVGLLFFYTGEFFLQAFFEYFLRINDFNSFRPTFYFFTNFLNILLYSCLSISFLCQPMLPGI